jgi:hypothetical protein
MEFTKEQKLYQDLVQKAWEDAEFKKELMTNPVEAIEKFTGVKLNLPEGKTVVVRDQSDASAVYINIPAKPDLNELELTEEQLEAVAGGKTDYDGWNPIIWAGIGAHELWNWATS